MQALVIKTFIDKLSGEQVREGARIEVTDVRGAELVAAGVAKAIEGEITTPEVKPKTKRKAAQID